MPGYLQFLVRRLGLPDLGIRTRIKGERRLGCNFQPDQWDRQGQRTPQGRSAGQESPGELLCLRIRPLSLRIRWPEIECIPIGIEQAYLIRFDPLDHIIIPAPFHPASEQAVRVHQDYFFRNELEIFLRRLRYFHGRSAFRRIFHQGRRGVLNRLAKRRGWGWDIEHRQGQPALPGQVQVVGRFASPPELRRPACLADGG